MQVIKKKYVHSLEGQTPFIKFKNDNQTALGVRLMSRDR